MRLQPLRLAAFPDPVRLGSVLVLAESVSKPRCLFRHVSLRGWGGLVCKIIVSH
ncbi:hypothetical protein ABH943_005224 [Caballeronia udeis]|uniref:Uncharacterized protein n=1 Tax=Caballeronia udeis TaxID=1232866 RepID=A0ABW8MP35_9BURK